MSETEHQHHQNHQHHPIAEAAQPAAAPVPEPTYAPAPAAPKSGEDDILGIISLVCIPFGLTLVGLILGLIGVSKAKKAGRSETLSRVGWIVNLVITVFVTLGLVLLVLAVMFTNSKMNDTVRKHDVNFIASELATYYTTNHHFPSDISEIKSAKKLAEESNDYHIEYVPQPQGCINDCSGYSLTTTLKDGTKYTVTR